MSQSFSYSAYTAVGDIEKGDLEAASLEAAATELTGRGLSVFQIDPKSASGEGFLSRELFSSAELKAGQKEEFLRLLSALIGARLPVDQALRSATTTDDRSSLAQMVKRLHGRIIDGQTLSGAIEAEGNNLPLSWAAMMRAGESSGRLDEVLQEMSEAQVRSNRVASEIRSALIYPALLGGLAIITVGFIVTVLLPALRPLIEETGGNLPGPVAFLMGVSDSLRSYPFLWLAGIGVFIFAMMRTFANPATRQAIDRLSLRAPLAGTLAREINAAKICNTLGLLLDNRVEQLKAVQITRSVISNASYQSLIDDLLDHLQNGGLISEGFGREGLIPDQVLNLVAAGERSGRIAEMLRESGKIMEGNAKRSLDRLVGLLTPALTLMLGLVIGGIVLSVMTTLMSVNNAAF